MSTQREGWTPLHEPTLHDVMRELRSINGRLDRLERDSE